MTGRLATTSEEDGVLVSSADVNGFAVSELRFPPGYVQDQFEPDLPYLAVVLEGALEKSFRSRTMQLERAGAVAMPAGAKHGARFGASGARIIVVFPKGASGAVSGCLDRLVELRGQPFSWLAWRLAGELNASDAAAPLAAEGLACELLAAASRKTRADQRARRRPAWLSSVEELLHTRVGDRLGLSDVADAVGVHPAHVARVFRARHGVSVGEYARRVRLAWAATEVARSDTPLAAIATRAGFSDQSHFTRLFKQHVGITPARYRAEAQRGNRNGA